MPAGIQTQKTWPIDHEPIIYSETIPESDLVGRKARELIFTKSKLSGKRPSHRRSLLRKNVNFIA